MGKNWVEIYLTGQEYKATMAVDLLKNAGIEAMILNQHDTAIKTFGNYLLHVDEADKTKAIEILKKLKN